MIVEYVRYQLDQAEDGKAFEDAYQQASPSLEQAPECLGYELSRCEEEPTRYILRIEWTSTQDHLEGFRKSELFKPFLVAVKPYIGQLEEMKHYRVTAVRS